MPVGISHIQITIPAGVVEIIAKDPGRDVVDSRIVQQAAQIPVLIREGDDARPGLVPMLFTVVSTAVVRSDTFERMDNEVHAVGHEPREMQVAESVEEIELLFRQLCVGHYALH